MDNDQDKNKDAQGEEREKVMVLTEVQMQRSRFVDYIAIVLGVGTVFILWLLQWMGLY